MQSLPAAQPAAQVYCSALTATPAERRAADFLAFLNDSADHHAEDYRPGWDEDIPDPPSADQAWWLGFRLGDQAIDAEPPAGTDEAAMQAFREGWAAGFDEFQAAIIEEERRIEERAELAGEIDPWMHWSEAEIVRAMGCSRAATGR